MMAPVDPNSPLATLDRSLSLARERETSALDRLTEAKALETGAPTNVVAQAILAAVPILAGAAFGGKRGARRGADASLAGQVFLRQSQAQKEKKAEKKQASEEAAALAALKDARQEIRALEKEQRAPEAARAKKLATQDLDLAQSAASAPNITVKTGNKLFENQADRLSKTLGESMDVLNETKGEAVQTLGVLNDAVSRGDVEEDENFIQAIGRNILGEINPKSSAGQIKRRMADALITKLKSIKGNASADELRLVKEASGTGVNVPLSVIRDLQVEAVEKAERKVFLDQLGLRNFLNDEELERRLVPEVQFDFFDPGSQVPLASLADLSIAPQAPTVPTGDMTREQKIELIRQKRRARGGR